MENSSQRAASSPSRSSGNAVSNTQQSKSAHLDYWHRASYEQRYQRAKDAGMSDSNAEEYANAVYSDISNTFWDYVGNIFGVKDSETKRYESNEAADTKLFNDLLDRQHNEDYTDPSAEVERRQNAGINDALTGGSEIGTGDTTDIDDLSSDPVGVTQALNSEQAEKPIKLAESLMTSLGGVMNLVTGGVNLQNALFSLDSSEVSSAFDIIGKSGDIGNFFPFLGYEFRPESQSWFNEKGTSVEGLTTPDFINHVVKRLTRSEFSDLIRKNTGVRSQRMINELWNSYRSLANPENINKYVQKMNDNLRLQNDTIDVSGAGIPRTGGLTIPNNGTNLPDPLINSPFISSHDKRVLQDYLGYTSDLYLFGLQANLSTSKNKITENDINQKCLDTLNNLVSKLQAEANVHHSPLANYLLVNMLSGSFNEAGQAALFGYGLNAGTEDKPKFLTKDWFSDAWTKMRDLSTFSFMGASHLPFKFSPIPLK